MVEQSVTAGWTEQATRCCCQQVIPTSHHMRLEHWKLTSRRSHHPTSLPRTSTNYPPRMHRFRGSRLLRSPQLLKRPHRDHLRISDHILPLHRIITSKQLSQQRPVSPNLSPILSSERGIRCAIKCKQRAEQCKFRPKQRKLISSKRELSCEFRSR